MEVKGNPRGERKWRSKQRRENSREERMFHAFSCNQVRLSSFKGRQTMMLPFLMVDVVFF
jgi:hypothetical protein